MVNITDGTIDTVGAGQGSSLNISGGTIHSLSVDGANTVLSGGSFDSINTSTDTVSALLANGYAYKLLPQSTWVDGINGEDARTLSGDIRVRSIPVKINTQPVDISFTYGDTEKTLTVAASGSSPISYQWYQNDNAVDGQTSPEINVSGLGAGSYQYFCRLTCEGYVLDSKTVTVTVEKATVTPPTVSDKEYSGQTQTSGVTVEEDTPYTVEADLGGTDVGTYDVVLKLKDTANYKWSDSEEAEKTIHFQITEADNGWTQKPAISDWTYGGTVSTPTGAAKFGTVKVEYKVKDADDITYSESVPTNAGSYTARFTVESTNNFTGLSDEKGFTILPKDITVTITPNGGTYGGTITPATAKLNGVVEGDSVDVTLTYTGTANDGTVASGTTAPTHAGTYTVTAAIKNSNYNLTGNTQADFKIEKATVTTPTVDSKVYTGETLTADVPPSDLYTVERNEGGTVVNASGYPVELKLKDDKNYQWDNAGGQTTFAITKATSNTWTTIPAITGWTYGETANQPIGAAQFGTMKVEYKVKDAEDGSYSATVPTQAGSYTARFTVADTNNFNGLSEVKDFTISKVSLTVKAKDHTITYGDAPANGGVEYSDFVDGEDASVLGGTLAYDYSYSRYGNVGDYTITPKGLTSGNYAITFEQGTLTVQQKEIGIDWSNTQLTYNGSAQIPTATPTGLENNDAITLAVSGEQTDAGNDYTAKVDAIQGTKAGNYTLPKDVTTTFSIAKKEVIITGTTVAATKVYDGNTTAQITSDGELQGKCDGDDLTIVRGTAAYNNKNVGESKTVTFSGFALDGPAAGNYTLTAQPASVTASITKKPVTLAITVGENLFDGTNGVNYSTSLESGTGFVDNDDVSIVPGDATFAYCYPAENIPVTFTAFSLSGADAGNYSITNPTPENVTGSIKVSDRYLNLENNDDFAGQTEVWVDGVACPVQTDVGTYAALPESGDLLTIYTYKQGTSTAAHENYPTGMAVYSIVRDDGGAKLQKIDELDNLLQYSGCSIRINGKPGIRMITSLTKETKEALKKGELAGYTLEEYGTVVAWDVGADMQLPLTLGSSNKHNYAYKKGVSDPVFANVGNLTQYTNVLVWDSLPDAQLAQDILMRPYIILSNEDGETVTLYGGTVSRSIGYVAQQNADTFPKGSAGYNYVHDIIGRVANLNQSNESTTTAGG